MYNTLRRKQSGYGGQTKPVFHKSAFEPISPLSKPADVILIRGEDDQEGGAEIRVHIVQVQGTGKCFTTATK